MCVCECMRLVMLSCVFLHVCVCMHVFARMFMCVCFCEGRCECDGCACVFLCVFFRRSLSSFFVPHVVEHPQVKEFLECLLHKKGRTYTLTPITEYTELVCVCICVLVCVLVFVFVRV